MRSTMYWLVALTVFLSGCSEACDCGGNTEFLYVYVHDPTTFGSVEVCFLEDCGIGKSQFGDDATEIGFGELGELLPLLENGNLDDMVAVTFIDENGERRAVVETPPEVEGCCSDWVVRPRVLTALSPVRVQPRATAKYETQLVALDTRRASRSRRVLRRGGQQSRLVAAVLRLWIARRSRRHTTTVSPGRT